VAVSREIVAQFEVRKTLIFLGNSAFGRPFFEPGGRGFESVRARLRCARAIHIGHSLEQRRTEAHTVRLDDRQPSREGI
jgi:hypothetical protein